MRAFKQEFIRLLQSPSVHTCTVARLQQDVGSIARDHISSNIWVKLALDAATAKPSDVAIFTDVRYPEEYSALKEAGAILVRVQGDPSGLRTANADKRNLNHGSEVALDDHEFDVVVQNPPDSLPLLREQAEMIMEQLTARASC